MLQKTLIDQQNYLLHYAYYLKKNLINLEKLFSKILVPLVFFGFKLIWDV